MKIRCRGVKPARSRFSSNCSTSSLRTERTAIRPRPPGHRSSSIKEGSHVRRRSRPHP
ncbi:hypothetical protein KCH_00250 [Kitasatospora cheerisanensis KCTC 2395]|uniref:Uncharacterized protein n=1 Tax=Kitasatospora cheerisanensis KCTC 2395 TaxID=1348663 RepID=A0A066ZDK0_9ACTN|nr:hypothetical protein KCH_00250 [Kitasatospora cheerisanensis KCTC 2395]